MGDKSEEKNNNSLEHGIVKLLNGVSDLFQGFGEVQKQVMDTICEIVEKKGKYDRELLENILTGIFSGKKEEETTEKQEKPKNILEPVFAEGRNEVAQNVILLEGEVSALVEKEIAHLLTLKNHKGKDDLYNGKKDEVVKIIHNFIVESGGIPLYTKTLENGELERDEELENAQKCYHIIAWTQLLLKEEKTPLRIDNPFQTLYPAEPNYPINFANENLNEKSYKKIIEDLLVKNIDEIIPLFLGIAEEIIEILKQGNILEISNHSSWFNAPFIATMLINYCKVHPEQIFIVLGPALVTGEFGKAGPIKVGNLLKTWPQTLNWANIPELKKLEKIVKKSFGENIKKYFLGNIIGNILLMFPSGTTDSFDKETKKIQLAPFSKGTRTLIKMILKNPQNFLHFIAVNDRKTMPTPTQFVREDVYVTMLEEFKKSLTQQDIDIILDSLPEYIIGKGEEKVGIWLEEDKEHV
ncbi:hypothetical protein HGA92_00515 [Candidatus Gracilibacteria bacterium]|nr:hypothetical protein [Candidatus Gracilibacteria bacterium]NUJ98908.1 hypothetical protein [Candidatus Gracilibacteria bacterium]